MSQYVPVAYGQKWSAIFDVNGQRSAYPVIFWMIDETDSSVHGMIIHGENDIYAADEDEYFVAYAISP